MKWQTLSINFSLERKDPVNPSVASLEAQYMYLRSKLPSLTAQAATDDERNQLLTAIAKSRDNYWLATRRILHDDDPLVASLVSQMNSEQLNLEAAVAHLDDFAKILNIINGAIMIGSRLADQAVAL